MSALGISDQELLDAEEEAHVVVQRIMDGIKPEQRVFMLGLLLSTVRHASETSQIIARNRGMDPTEWQEAFIAVVSTIIVQFNYDCLSHLGTAEVVQGITQVMERFAEQIADGLAHLPGVASGPTK